jgi:phage repressor protein C with HTH and peptisase S24 domain
VALTWTAVAIVLCRTRPALYRVDGPSMLPVLPNGTVTLGVRASHVSRGDIVVVRDPLGRGFVIKRVRSVDPGASRLWLVGDNPESSVDSRKRGWVTAGSVRARVVLAFRR